MLPRIQRDTVLICLALALGAFFVWPRTLAAAGGVLGGGLLVALSYWAIRGAVDAVLVSPGAARPGRHMSLVKTFTRHAILALAAYGMMARLRADPVALLIGVTSLAVAVGIEATRVLAGGRARPDR